MKTTKKKKKHNFLKISKKLIKIQLKIKGEKKKYEEEEN
jgi:hypothetical protein